VSALFVSFLTFPWLMSMFVVFLLVDGALVISLACLGAWQHEQVVAPMLLGLANMLLAATLLAVPTVGVQTLVLLLAAWAAVTGVLGIGVAGRGAGRQGRFILLAVGSLSICWAGLLSLTDLVQPMALAWWLGLYAFFLGFMLLALAPRLRANIS
jgi:uncharacterized membrane protein HdeD (DUF308 family)